MSYDHRREFVVPAFEGIGRRRLRSPHLQESEQRLFSSFAFSRSRSSHEGPGSVLRDREEGERLALGTFLSSVVVLPALCNLG